ncbi:STAS domain-containing protein [Poriferisphaera sp. WC338]|uniref:STAS domain-containing protein n=1 Tax=Poriferisphaera sp. WC338 TaxID=3425129 RepID=UPI003D812779
MEIKEEKKGAVVVVRPIGPLTRNDVSTFKSCLMRIRSDSMGRFILDASSIAYVDSTGLEVMLEVNDELSQAGQILKLCSLNETVREVLDLTELANFFECYEDVGSAVRSFL